MQDRIKMNTESLQKEFPDVYEDFFVNHDLVVSGCFSLAWSPSGIGNRLDHIRVKSKLPMRLYIWINKTEKRGVSFWNVTSFDIVENNFHTNNFLDINKECWKLSDFVELFLDNDEINFWLEISVLSEVSRWHGFGFSWTFAATLAVWMFLLTEKLDNKLLQDSDNFINDEVFKNISLLSWNMVNILKNKNTTLSNSLTTLSPFKNPTFFSSENISWKKTLEEINYDFYDLIDKFASDVVSSEMPLDYCIIYSWMPSEAHRVKELKKFDIKKFNNYELFWNDVIDNLENSWIYSSKFIEKDSIYNHLNDNAIILTIKLIKLLIDIYEVWYDNKLVEELIDNINNFWNTLSLIEKKNNFVSEFNYFFRKNRSSYDEQIWIMPIYSGKIWWWYLIVSKQFQSRETITKTLRYTQNQYPNSRLEYSSWLDWNETSGVLLKQYASEWFYSKYFDENKLILETNKGRKMLWDHEDLMWEIKEWIIIDQIARKVYVNGRKLTSKDIPSQATTVEVLSLLIVNIGKEVSNNKFEVSSYSKNKNDMIWKIVIPLTKLTKKYFDKEIDIICKGSLIEFYMILQEKDIEIWVIKTLK